MSGLFAPKVKIPDAPAPPPTIDEAGRAQDRTDQLRRRRGRAATVLVPDGGMGSAAVKPLTTILGGA